MSPHLRRARVAVGVAMIAGALLAGCGSPGTVASDPTSRTANAPTTEDAPTKASVTTTQATHSHPTLRNRPRSSSSAAPPSPAASTVVPAANDVPGACSALIRMDAVPQPDEGPDAPPDPAALKRFGEAVLPPLQEAMAKGGDVLAASLRVLEPLAKAAAAQGTPFPDDEGLMAVVAAYHGWAHKNCGFQNVDITAVDYKFESIPATLKAGPTSIGMMNGSDKGEFHVAVIVKPKDPKITTVQQLLAIPMPQMEGSFDMVGSAAAPPGMLGGVLLDLAPGRYFIVCPIPIGGDEASGDMHMLHGMATAFEVD